MTTFDSNDLPYAADDIANLRIILDARRHTEALADDPRVIEFHVHESRVYQIRHTPEALDEIAPGWREALARPADHDAPGRRELEDALTEDMTDRNELESRTVMRIEVVPLDRTPIDLQIVRTTVEDVTVEAAELDYDAPGWRAALDTDEPEEHLNRWIVGDIARVATVARAEAEGDGQSPSAVLSVEIRSITQ